LQKETYENIVRQCASLIDTAHQHEIDRIALNLELGEIVGRVLKNAKYGDRSIEKLAADISTRRGRTVYPQRLYEAYEVWSTVGSIDKVYEIQKKIGEDITWNWLVKNTVRDFQNEPHDAVKKEKIEKTFKQIETAAEKIEKLSSAKDSLDESIKEQAAGVIARVVDAARQFVGSCNEQEHRNNGSNDGNGNNGGAFASIETKQAIAIEESDEEQIESVSIIAEIVEMLDLAIETMDWDMVIKAKERLVEITSVSAL